MTDFSDMLEENGTFDKEVTKPTLGKKVTDIYAALGSYLKASLVYNQSNDEAIEAFSKKLGGKPEDAKSLLVWLDGLSW